MSSEEIFDLTVSENANTFVQVIRRVIENPESLGQEFETILFDNLWELYEE